MSRIHYILAAVEDPTILSDFIDRSVVEAANEFHVPPLAELRQRAVNSSRWDTQEVSYIKRTLQDGLPCELRRRLIDELFAKFVSNDARSFAEDVYLNVDQAREMCEQGMHIGSNGERHERLSLKNAQSQRREIEESLRLFSAIGQPSRGFTFCYPYGDYNSDTAAILEDMGCSVAVTTKLGVAEVRKGSMLELPRANTNDLPVGM